MSSPKLGSNIAVINSITIKVYFFIGEPRFHRFILIPGSLYYKFCAKAIYNINIEKYVNRLL